MRYARKERSEWELCFAWLPRLVGGEWVWLEWLERRVNIHATPLPLGPIAYVYRLPQGAK
jgi:hypothetical protein